MRSVAEGNANIDLSYLLFQRYQTFEEMDPLDLALLTTFHPLNEPAKFSENGVDEDREFNPQAKVDDNCPKMKFETFGSTKSSGRGRGKLREPVEVVDDSFIAREIRELSDQRSSFVFSRFKKSSNLNFVSSDDSVKKDTKHSAGFEESEKAKGVVVTEAVPTQKKLGRGRGRARKLQVDTECEAVGRI